MRFLNIKLASALAIIGATALLAFGISQETPIGMLAGRVVALESGNPIPAWINLSGKIDGEQVYFRKQAKDDGTFSFTRLPVGTYKLEITGEAHHIRPMDITIVEGRTHRLEVELEPNKPFLDLFVHQHVFTPDEKPQVTSRGFVDSDNVTLDIYKVDLNAFLIDYNGSLQRLLGIESRFDGLGNRVMSAIDAKNNPDITRVDTLQIPTAKRNAEGIFVQRVDLPKLAPGIYALSTTADDVRQIDWIMVTSLGLVTKCAGGDLLAYTVDLKSGKPVTNAGVQVYTGAVKNASGTTGTDGLVNLSPAAQKGESQKTIIARSGESFAFVTSWFSGIEGSNRIIYAYTERPVYRPGQRVYFRGIVRESEDNKYRVTANQPVTVEVRDDRDTLIYRGDLKTDRFGCYFGDFKLNDETASGYYGLTTSINGERIGDGAGFQVASYRKPEFSVKVKFPKKRYVRGENVRAKISAAYYFGAPVVNAKVTYFVRRSPYWLFEGEDDYEYDYEGDGYEGYGGYGEYVSEGEIRTDSRGEAEIEFPAIWPQPKEEDAWDNDQQFSVEVTVQDSSEREVTSEGSVIATRGEFAIEVTPDRYVVSPGGAVVVDIRAMDFDKHPIKNQKIEIVMGRTVWSNDYEESSFQRVSSRTVITDNEGRASFTLEAKKPGDIEIIAKARDRRGNSIVGRSSVWSYTGEFGEDYGYRYSDLEIVTDKKTYNPGDTAKVLINSSRTGMTALVTVEGEQVYQRMTVPLKSKSTMVEIPIRGEYKPNFYIGVCYVNDKDFVSQEARANVSLKAESLIVKIEPNKRKYAPGENATFKIETTDSKGRPVSAELSVGVVDEAIYAIAEDNTPNMLDYFYSRRENSVRTSFSFPQIYLSDPDKAGAGFKGIVRKRFVDTAFWSPNVITDANGEASVTGKMPDNLTTWRITVRAITMTTECGEARGTVITQKDLLVRLELPRFLIQTDSSTISAIVHNYTGKTQRVKVDLKAPGLKLDGNFRQQITVEDKGNERVDWTVQTSKPGDFPITAYAMADTASDAVEITLPIHPHGIERQTMQTGSLGKSESVRLSIPVRNDSIPESTRLKIRLAPSIASTLLGSLQYLAQYPYGCTEQTTSSFLPDVILWQSMRNLGINLPWLQAQLPEMVSRGLFKLYRFQLEDGGWSWYEYGKADPWMTAYVCYALIQAKAAGFAVNENILERGVGRLSALVNQPKLDPENKAYAAYVLALAGQNTSQQLGEVAALDHLDSKTITTVALGFAELGRTDHAKSALGRLLGRAVVESNSIHWTSRFHWMSDDIETTALALQAVIKITPGSPHAAKIAQWLMERRQSGYWYSTRDTAMVLYAMSGYLKQTRELEPNYTATVLINGKPAGTFRFDRASVFEPDIELSIKGTALRKGGNHIEITKSGTGNLYYTTDLRQYLARKHIPAIVTGARISVARSYYNPSPQYYEGLSDKNLGREVGSCEVGDVILVRLLIYNKRRLDHMMLDDYIPAGFEIVDKGYVEPWDWNYWWCGRDVRDNKVSFYLESISPGKHVVDYQMRASTRGEYHAMPAQLWAMYETTIRAGTAESGFNVR
ncbi:MAG: alpha-2-macroglobulin family protein [Armatimonadota bacterium]